MGWFVQDDRLFSVQFRQGSLIYHLYSFPILQGNIYQHNQK